MYSLIMYPNSFGACLDSNSHQVCLQIGYVFIYNDNNIMTLYRTKFDCNIFKSFRSILTLYEVIREYI